MYGGIATPSESAAVGVLGAVIVAALQGGLTLQGDARHRDRRGA